MSNVQILSILAKAVNAVSGIHTIKSHLSGEGAKSIASKINRVPSNKRRAYFKLRAPYVSMEFTLVAKAFPYDGAWSVQAKAHKCICKCEHCGK